MDNDNIQQSFPTPQAALKHYGKKGMKWGVRNDEKPSGSTKRGSITPIPESSSADLAAAASAVYSKKNKVDLQLEGQKKLEAQAKQSFPMKIKEKRMARADEAKAESKELTSEIKSLQKERDALDSRGISNKLKRASLNSKINATYQERNEVDKLESQLRSGKLTSGEKKALIALGAAAVYGGLTIYGMKAMQDPDLGTSGVSDKISSRMRRKLFSDNKNETSAQWRSMFGEDYPSGKESTFALRGGGSFYQGLTNGKSLTRPEFTIPAGTIFQRLSNREEDSGSYGKTKGAYATFLSNDKKIYGSSVEFGGKNYTIKFEADGPVRVPSTKTVLAHLREIQKQDWPNMPHKWTDESVMMQYHSMAGGSWSGSSNMRLFDSLRSHGYSAIVDDMDAGYLGDLPVVFFGKAKPASATPRNNQHRTEDKHGIMKMARRYA